MAIYLSASSIADYIRCSQKVLYRTTKPFKEVQSPEMKIGNIVHKVLETSWKDSEEATSTAIDLCRVHNLGTDEIGRTLSSVSSFFYNHVGKRLELTDDDEIEHSFKLKLYSDVYLVGKMDRISSGGVIDWKTGFVSTPLGGNVQCIVYDYAYEKEFGSLPSYIKMVSLSNGYIHRYERNDYFVKQLFDLVIPSMLKTMKTGSYEKRGIFNGSCRKCQYRIGCLGG